MLVFQQIVLYYSVLKKHCEKHYFSIKSSFWWEILWNCCHHDYYCNTLLFIMNDKRKCLFLAELEVMFFSLPITFKYNLLYSWKIKTLYFLKKFNYNNTVLPKHCGLTTTWDYTYWLLIDRKKLKKTYKLKHQLLFVWGI